VRETIRWITTRPDRLDRDDAGRAEEHPLPPPGTGPSLEHADDFARMMTKLEGRRLRSWTTAVEANTLPALTSFARSLRRDLAAVTAGLTLPHSSAVEGNVIRSCCLPDHCHCLARIVRGRLACDPGGPRPP